MIAANLKINIPKLVFIILLAVVGIFFFFHKLSSIPPGFYVDEALHGYSAYSILETGKDEYGKSFPLVFRLYGSYNEPLYIYLSTIPIKLWDLNVFSVRFMAALSGLATVFVIYLFLKSMKISTLGSLFFAITPTVVFQGRVGYEVALAFFLFCLGSLFLWYSLSRPKWIVPAFIVLSLSTYAAYAERFTIPFLITFFFIAFRKRLLARKNLKYFIYGVFLLVLTQIPHLFLLTTPAFFPKAGELGSQAIVVQADKLTGIIPGPVALSISFIREFLSQFVNYFSPRTLFLVGDKDLPGLSLFYAWMIVPYLLGLTILWRKRGSDTSIFILLLALTTPITASLTKDPFPVHRVMPLVLPLALIISIGIDRLFKLNIIGKRNINFLIIKGIALVIFIVSIVFFWRSYFVFFPKEKAKYWGYGYDTLAQIIKTSDEHFMIDRERLPIPYTELLFFLKVPPEEFQNSVDQNIKANYYQNLPFDQNFRFANVETRGIDWEKDIYRNQVLVGDSLAISEDQAKEHFLTKIFEIKDPLGEVVFVGYRTNPAQKCRTTRNISPLCKAASTF